MHIPSWDVKWSGEVHLEKGYEGHNSQDRKTHAFSSTTVSLKVNWIFVCKNGKQIKTNHFQLSNYRKCRFVLIWIYVQIAKRYKDIFKVYHPTDAQRIMKLLKNNAVKIS